MKTLFLFALTFGLVFASQAQSEWSGSWTKKDYSIKGTWKIQKQDDGKFVLTVDDEFSTKKAPDLKFFLSKLEGKDLRGKNAAKESVLIAPLKSNKGKQSYTLPENLNPSDFKTLVLHCEQYSVLWGVASLK